MAAWGAGHARNVGIHYAKAALIAFLDADDVLLPRFIEATLQQFSKANGARYVYTDWISLNKEGKLEDHVTPEFRPQDVFTKTSIHSINILIRKEWLLQVGGFDEQMPAWEDTDLFMKLAAAGLCGTRVPEKLLVYRYTTGALREIGASVKDDLLALLRSRYHEYMEGNKVCGCSDLPTKAKMMAVPASNSGPDMGMIRVEYQGPEGMHSVIGAATRQQYGRRKGGDVFYVFLKDQQAAPDVMLPMPEMLAVMDKQEAGVPEKV